MHCGMNEQKQQHSGAGQRIADDVLQLFVNWRALGYSSWLQLQKRDVIQCRYAFNGAKWSAVPLCNSSKQEWCQIGAMNVQCCYDTAGNHSSCSNRRRQLRRHLTRRTALRLWRKTPADLATYVHTALCTCIMLSPHAPTYRQYRYSSSISIESHRVGRLNIDYFRYTITSNFCLQCEIVISDAEIAFICMVKTYTQKSTLALCG